MYPPALPEKLMRIGICRLIPFSQQYPRIFQVSYAPSDAILASADVLTFNDFSAFVNPSDQTGKVVVGYKYAEVVDVFPDMKNIRGIYCHGKVSSVPVVGIILYLFNPMSRDAFFPIRCELVVAVYSAYDSIAHANIRPKYA